VDANASPALLPKEFIGHPLLSGKHQLEQVRFRGSEFNIRTGQRANLFSKEGFHGHSFL